MRLPQRAPLTICTLSLFGAACAADLTVPASAVVAHATLAADRDGGPAGTDATADFETFALGGINGQHDWKSTAGLAPTDPTPRCANYDHAVADVAAVLAADHAPSALGRRSLRVSNAVTSGCYADQTFSQRAADVAGERGARSTSASGAVDFALPGARLQSRFDAEWVFGSATPSAAQPGLEVVASPARGDDLRMGWVQMADWPDGLAIVVAARADPNAPGAFQRDTVARGLDRRRLHAIRLTIDFVDGPLNDVVRVYVDGALRHVGGSWETYYRGDANGIANFGGATPAVNRLMFRTGSDTHRGVPGDPAPATLGKGFLIDQVRVAAYSPPRDTDDCRDRGWRDRRDEHGRPFDNQGECVRSLRVRESDARGDRR